MASSSPPDLCIIRNCAEVAQRVGGFCVLHGHSFRRSASLVLPSNSVAAPTGTCVVASCTQPTVLIGYCAAHVRIHTGLDTASLLALTNTLLRGTNATSAPMTNSLSDLLEAAVAAKHQSDVLLHIQQDIYRESSSDRVLTKIFDAVNQLIQCDRITCFVVDTVRKEFVGRVASAVTAEALRMVRVYGRVSFSRAQPTS